MNIYIDPLWVPIALILTVVVLFIIPLTTAGSAVTQRKIRTAIAATVAMTFLGFWSGMNYKKAPPRQEPPKIAKAAPKPIVEMNGYPVGDEFLKAPGLYFSKATYVDIDGKDQRTSCFSVLQELTIVNGKYQTCGTNRFYRVGQIMKLGVVYEANRVGTNVMWREIGTLPIQKLQPQFTQKDAFRL